MHWVSVDSLTLAESNSQGSNKKRCGHEFIYTYTFELFHQKKTALPHCTINRDILYGVCNYESTIQEHGN